VIALLGHEDVQTTHVYLQADLAMKEKALGKVAPPEIKMARFKPCDEVLAFLASFLTRCARLPRAPTACAAGVAGRAVVLAHC
jgi:hypothetical protein